MTKIHPTAVVDPGARVGADAEIGPGAVVGPHVTLGDRVRIMAHAYIDGRTTLGPECTVFPGASLGCRTQALKTPAGPTYVEIGAGTTIRECVTVNSGSVEGETTRIGAGCLLMACSHVAHGCRVGDRVIMANCVALAGEVQVEEMAVIGGLAAVHQFVRVGRMAMIGGCSKIAQDCPPFMLVDGNPARIRGPNSVGLRRQGIGAPVRQALKEAYRILWRRNLAVGSALACIEAELPPSPELRHLVDFIRGTRRGIIGRAGE